MQHQRYFAEFYSADDTLYRVEIWQEAATAYTPVEVSLAAQPVTIDWPEVEKLDPVHTSAATLRLISESDRQFYDMYAVSYGEIALKVYRNGALYWHGLLDPELFEEPYAYANNYITELTFSDLGALEYRYWEDKGSLSVEAIVRKCMEAVGLDAHALRTIISTTPDPMGVFVSGENFFDEDGEGMTMREVLDEVLRPFALQLVQKNGEIAIFDLNALSAQSAVEVQWYSNNAVLEADKIYNDVSVKFSPYSDQTIIKAEIDEEDDLGATNFAICAGYTEKALAGPVPIGTTDANSQLLTAYNLHYTSEGGTIGKMTAKNGAVFFRVEPVYSGNKDAGVLWAFSMGAESTNANLGWRPNTSAFNGSDFEADTSTYEGTPLPIISIPRFYAAADNRIRPDMLCVSLEMMYDARTNPYEDADFFTESDKAAYEQLLNEGHYCYVPAMVYLCDENGNRTHHYRNSNTAVGDGLFQERDGWREIGTTMDLSWPFFFCYYDDSEAAAKGVMQGWVKNKRIVGKKTPSLTETFRRKNNGEYIPMPPTNGYIEIEVYPGVAFQDAKHNWRPSGRSIYKPKHGMIAYKSLEVKVVPSYGKDDVEKTDIEDIAWINPAARENLKIDTIVGTPKTTMPTARGVLRSANGVQIDTFTRAGHTDRIERLLIGTAYSQYAGRKNVLNGTVELLPSFAPLADAATVGKHTLVSEVQDLEAATSEVRMVEFSADEYESIEDKKE